MTDYVNVHLHASCSHNSGGYVLLSPPLIPLMEPVVVNTAISDHVSGKLTVHQCVDEAFYCRHARHNGDIILMIDHVYWALVQVTAGFSGHLLKNWDQ